MTKLEQRINIVFNLKVTFGHTKGDFKKRIKNIKITLFLLALFPLLGLCITLIAIFSNLNLIASDLWSKSTPNIILSIVFSLNLPYLIYQLILFNHASRLENIKDQNPNGIDFLNENLKAIINRINRRFKDSWALFAFALFIIAIAIIQMLSEGSTPYWDNMVFPVLLFFIMYVFKVYSNYKKMKLNINKAEALIYK